MMARIRRYFLAGLLVLVPLWVTFLAIHFVAKILDGSLRLLPMEYRPEQLLGFSIPGFGIIITLILILITGFITTNFLGRSLLHFWERLVAKIPLVGAIYSAVKQVLHTLFTPGGQSFRKVLLVEYPRQGLWSIAFQTSTASEEMHQKSGHELVAAFIPTTPNPTSGFLIMVPKNEVHELNMSVDEALKMVISLGVVMPKFDKDVRGKQTESSS